MGVPSGLHVYITMENHHFYWVDQPFNYGHFQVRNLLVYQAGYHRNDKASSGAPEAPAPEAPEAPEAEPMGQDGPWPC